MAHLAGREQRSRSGHSHAADELRGLPSRAWRIQRPDLHDLRLHPLLQMAAVMKWLREDVGKPVCSHSQAPEGSFEIQAALALLT